jgi:DNA (cytosine-5)-methyltransferase 1
MNSGEINLPTPTRSDYKGPNHSNRRTTSAKGLPARAIDQIGWGKFEPAIRRWESLLGRPAPEPTKADGKDGNIRLSSSFSEWMMGLPEDWVCSQGLSRNDELKLIGNGVVPRQAQLALSILLQDTGFLKENNENL